MYRHLQIRLLFLQRVVGSLSLLQSRPSSRHATCHGHPSSDRPSEELQRKVRDPRKWPGIVNIYSRTDHEKPLCNVWYESSFVSSKLSYILAAKIGKMVRHHLQLGRCEVGVCKIGLNVMCFKLCHRVGTFCVAGKKIELCVSICFFPTSLKNCSAGYKEGKKKKTEKY